MRKIGIAFLLLLFTAAGCSKIPRIPIPFIGGDKEAAEAPADSDDLFADATSDGASDSAGDEASEFFAKLSNGGKVGSTDDADADVDAEADPEALPTEPEVPENPSLDGSLEDIKTALVELKRDLVVLEEDLLFPASSQVAVFVSMDIGEFFQLDSVTLKLNGKEVAHHLYTERQVDALYRGGVQRLFVGNVKQGENRVTAFFTGRGPSGRDYRRATTIPFDKSFEPVFVELKIGDSTAKYQPEFSVSLSN